MAAQIATNSYVLRPEVAAACFDALWSRDVHAQFPAYLHLRQQAQLVGSLSGIQPHWSALGKYLAVPGGPSRRPYLRPFWTGKRTSNQEWFNGNFAGSYAPSSQRSRIRMVVDVDEQGRYSLPADHPQRALELLLYNQPLSVIALAGFLFREFAVITAGSIQPSDLVTVFRYEFGYRMPEDDAEFATLYTTELPFDLDEWFDPWRMTS